MTSPRPFEGAVAAAERPRGGQPCPDRGIRRRTRWAGGPSRSTPTTGGAGRGRDAALAARRCLRPAGLRGDGGQAGCGDGWPGDTRRRHAGPAVRPVVRFGVGGSTGDLMGDRAYRLLLLTDLDAERLITSLRCSPLLFGHRGRPRADVAARVRGWVAFAAVDALQELVQVGAGEPPVEGFGDGVVAGFERGEAVADLAQVGEVVRADDLRWTTEK